MAVSETKRIRVHKTQAAAAIERELFHCLLAREISPQFLYRTTEQAQKWLKLHEAYSPARLDPECVEIYRQAFEAAARNLLPGPVQLFGLSAGGAQKERSLLEVLHAAGHPLAFSPVDVSEPLVLKAIQSVGDCVPPELSVAGVNDLGRTEDVREFIESLHIRGHQLLFTFFGTIHNFEPDIILPRLREAVREPELLLLSANMAPSSRYEEKVQELLTAYDNQLTRDWLLAFLPTVGLREDQGKLKFSIQSSGGNSGLKRIMAHFEFSINSAARVGQEQVLFGPGESLRLFYSYRYTPPILQRFLEQNGFVVLNQWLTSSEEEGVFVTRPAKQRNP